MSRCTSIKPRAPFPAKSFNVTEAAKAKVLVHESVNHHPFTPLFLGTLHFPPQEASGLKRPYKYLGKHVRAQRACLLFHSRLTVQSSLFYHIALVAITFIIDMASSQVTPDALPGFTRLTPGVLLHNSSEPSSRSDSSPSLIILCTWVSASRRNIAKYTSHYQMLYPLASLLVIESTVKDMVFGTDNSQAKRFAPAREVILAHSNPGKPRSVLLHIFSNGGSQSAGRLLVSLPQQARQVMLRAIVLDSCPGKGTLDRSVEAMVVSLPRTWFFRVFGRLIVYLLCVFVMVMDEVFGVENVVTVAGRRLLDDELIPKHVPRAYLYSRTDKMVWCQDVKEHADQARQKGYAHVGDVMFEQGQHCAHIQKNGTEYWQAVNSVIRSGGTKI